MRRNRDLWILLGALALGAVLVFLQASGQDQQKDAPSSYSPGKKGMKALYLGLESLGFNVGRLEKPLTRIPKGTTVLISGPTPNIIADKQVKALSKWLRSGNTLILAEPEPTMLTMELGFMPDNSHDQPGFPVKVPATRSRYSAGVKRVELYPLEYVDTYPDDTVLARVNGGVAAVERPVGRGRVILIMDPAMIANSGVGTEDNFVLLSNLVYEHAGRNDRVLFAEWTRMSQDEPVSPGPLLGRAGNLALGELALVLLLVLLSSSRRFGAVHPLKDREERRQGAEFVRAMAGLYRRAKASGAASISVYQLFRREIFSKFGVPPEAGPREAVETIQRARTIGAEELMTLFQNGDHAVDAPGQVTEDEAVALVKSIEKARRELGVARTRED